MIRLLCRENFLEYTGDGYVQCMRHDVNCPKKENNRILGFDCLVYVDNLPKGYELDRDKSVIGGVPVSLGDTKLIKIKM